MYNSAQTFFDDESPPTSPIDAANPPTFHLSPAPPGQKALRSEHRRWNSLSRLSPSPLPFSYEYIFEEGKLAGLAEYHPDQDFLHYSSSRSSSVINSRNPSRRASAEHSARSPTETTCSHSSELLRTQPSPRTSDKIKRAFSLSRTRSQRRKPVHRERTPSPVEPRGIGPECQTTAILAEPTSTKRDNPSLVFQSSRAAPPTPTRRTTAIKNDELSPASTPRLFESTRAVPQPPPKPISRSAKPASETITVPEVGLVRKDSKGKQFQNDGTKTIRPRQRSVSRKVLADSALEPASTGPTMSDTSQEKVAARPPLRHMTSRFIEHFDENSIEIDDAGKPGGSNNTFIPPYDSMLPKAPTRPDLTQAARQQGMPRQLLERPRAVARRDPNYIHPEWPSIFKTSPAKPTDGAPARIVPKSTPDPRTQPVSNRALRKRSTSNMKMKAPEPMQPTSTSLKRAISMRTRPPAMWADVCMAELKPTLMSPVVASGHARMISC